MYKLVLCTFINTLFLPLCCRNKLKCSSFSNYTLTVNAGFIKTYALVALHVASVIKHFGLMEKVNGKIIENTGHTFSGWMNLDVMIFLSYIAKTVFKLANFRC